MQLYRIRVVLLLFIRFMDGEYTNWLLTCIVVLLCIGKKTVWRLVNLNPRVRVLRLISPMTLSIRQSSCILQFTLTSSCEG